MNIHRKSKRNTNAPKYKNVLEAIKQSTTLRIVSGVTVMVMYHDGERGVRARFSSVGFACLALWVSTYFYCTYTVYSEDQTVLRRLYNTKLRHYGDIFERVTSMIYVLFSIWKIPFDLSGNTDRVQSIFDIDKMIQDLGVTMDYTSLARSILINSVAQLLTWFTRFLSVWLTQTNIDVSMPIEVIFQGAYADSLALLATGHYCYYLVMLTERYKIVNNLMTEIKERKSWEHKMFIRDKRQSANMQRALALQDKYICEKVKACARIYSALYKATGIINELFGLQLTLTLTICLLYIIVNLFYFMEATAAGMFHDPLRYSYFLIYISWRIFYSFGVVFMIIYFSENVVKQAANTSYITHQIMNNDLSPSITLEAVQLSRQLMHQMPVYTASGLVKLGYPLLLEGALTVTTFLIMLLQFVAK